MNKGNKIDVDCIENNMLAKIPQNISECDKKDRYKMYRENASIFIERKQYNEKIQEKIDVQNNDIQGKFELEDKTELIKNKKYISFISKIIGKEVVTTIKKELPSCIKISDKKDEKNENQSSLCLSKREKDALLVDFISQFIKKYINKNFFSNLFKIIYKNLFC